MQFQPSEIEDPALLASINKYVADLPNVSPPMTLNATNDDHWAQVLGMVKDTGPFDMVYMGNVLHIAPWEVTLAVAKNVPKLLPTRDGIFVVYGPFKRDGKFTTPSNEEVRWAVCGGLLITH